MSELNFMAKHFSLLGMRVKDNITGFKGVATSISFDLYGCIQLIITSKANADGNVVHKWFDVSRLKVTSDKRVMDVPNFIKGQIAEGKKGAAEKPLP